MGAVFFLCNFILPESEAGKMFFCRFLLIVKVSCWAASLKDFTWKSVIAAHIDLSWHLFYPRGFLVIPMGSSSSSTPALAMWTNLT